MSEELPEIDFTVAALLMLYVKRNLKNTTQLLSYPPKDAAVYNMGDLVDDIEKTDISREKFQIIEKFYSDNVYGCRKPVGVIGLDENASMVTLRESIIPQIMGFHFGKWYVMENGEEHRPYLMHPSVNLVQYDGAIEATGNYQIAGVFSIAPQAMPLSHFQRSIIREFEGELP